MKILHLPIIFFAGLSLAGWSVKYALENNYGSNIIQVGPWSALPFVGGKQVDPYTKSILAVSGKIPLGVAEGLAFTATTDDSENSLRRNCNYSINGTTPISRLWTITAYDLQGNPINPENGQRAGLLSNALLRFPNSSFKIALGDVPQSGNWIPLSGDGDFKLILRLYDTPIVSDVGVTPPTMPSIVLEECER